MNLINVMSWRIIILGIVITFAGIILALVSNDHLIPPALILIGIEIVILEFLRKYIYKRQSIKVIGVIVVLLSMLNFLIHEKSLILYSRISKLYNSDHDINLQIFKVSFWLLISIWTLFQGVRLIIRNEKIEFSTYIASKSYKLLVGIIILLFILELPIYEIIAGYGGVYGRRFIR